MRYARKLVLLSLVLPLLGCEDEDRKLIEKFLTDNAFNFEGCIAMKSNVVPKNVCKSMNYGSPLNECVLSVDGYINVSYQQQEMTNLLNRLKEANIINDWKKLNTHNWAVVSKFGRTNVNSIRQTICVNDYNRLTNAIESIKKVDDYIYEVNYLQNINVNPGPPFYGKDIFIQAPKSYETVRLTRKMKVKYDNVEIVKN